MVQHGKTRISGCVRARALQNGAKTAQGDVLVPDHIPKVKASFHFPCMHASACRPPGP